MFALSVHLSAAAAVAAAAAAATDDDDNQRRREPSLHGRLLARLPTRHRRVSFELREQRRLARAFDHERKLAHFECRRSTELFV